MNVIEALNERYSARAYKAQPVSREVLEKVMEAANRAPSWANTQPWELYVAGGEPLDRIRAAFAAQTEQGIPSNPDIPRPATWPASIRQRMLGGRPPASPAEAPPSEEERRRMMMRRTSGFFGAPVVIYLCMDRTLTPYSVYDLGLVSQSIMLAAKEYGLDTIVAVNLVGYPDIVRKELGIPDELMLVLGIALGYAEDATPNRTRSVRRPLAEAVRFHGV